MFEDAKIEKMDEKYTREQKDIQNITYRNIMPMKVKIISGISYNTTFYKFHFILAFKLFEKTFQILLTQIIPAFLQTLYIEHLLGEER